MSGVLTALTRVFIPLSNISKKAMKIAKTVAPIALAAAAVIFTGGAALGLTPTFAGAVGGLASSLGLSGTLAGALTGSIVSAGFGSAVGLLTGGIKGAQKGLVGGLLTGGALGALSPGIFGMGATAATATPAAAAVPTGGGLLPSGGLGTITTGAPAATGASVAAPAAAATAAHGNGLLSGLTSNPAGMMVAGNVLQGLFTPSEASEAARLRKREGERLFSDAYSTDESSPVTSSYGEPHVGVRPVRRFRFNPETLQVEEVATTG